MIVLTLPQHLTLKLHLSMLPGPHQDAHDFIRDSHVSVKQFPKGHSGAAIWIRIRHSPYNEAHVIYLAVDVRLGAPGPFCCLAALFGSPVAFLALPQTGGHGILVIKVLAEGVELLIDGMLGGPVLPPAFQVAHSAVFLRQGVYFVGIFYILLVPVTFVKM